MGLDKEVILERKDALVDDLEKTKNKHQDIEKAKLENVALQNALAGAIQQCDDFLKRLDDESSDEG
jgi:ornithine cyclodeaminase/alanine dehydrogenase-like protein (mu-crystallin family)